MVTPLSSSTRMVGYRAAVAATIFSLAYVVAQLAEWAGWLGSAGGPESMSTPLGIVVLLTPSLLLGPSFLLLMAAVHDAAPPHRRVWTISATLFAAIYTALISINYFVQLAWVGPRLVAGRTDGMEAFLFVPFDSFLYAVDILGYSFMSAATLCAAMAFEGRGLEAVARAWLIATGWVMPFLLFQMAWHPLIWIASAWAVTFPASTWTLARLFRQAEVAAPDAVVVATVVARATVRGMAQVR